MIFSSLSYFKLISIILPLVYFIPSYFNLLLDFKNSLP
jgi:hypothetical protein